MHLRTFFRVLKLVSILLLSGLAFTYAQTSNQEEAIVSFGSTVQVNLDNAVDVTERIVYTTGPQERHGIYRDIYPYSSTGKKMELSGFLVKDENDNSLAFTVTDNPDTSTVRIKIGDPNRTFTGVKTYTIVYHVSHAVAQLSGVDEIYWNATGNEWQFPIYAASATVILPPGVGAIQQACYFGKKGSKDQCDVASSTAQSTYTFNSPQKLSPCCKMIQNYYIAQIEFLLRSFFTAKIV